mmetsp:Transcript_15414/g.42063  ORF Transcript_15414/g.42063 Transcript_15414/m.42063 type:complete len:812 (-) Transcript_15414:138-2573(-)
MGTSLRALVLSIAVFTRAAADSEQCQTDEQGRTLCSNLLLQSRAGTINQQRVLTDDATGGDAAWTATSFGDCMSDCGYKRFREVVCRSLADGKPAHGACTGPRPANHADCTCGDIEPCRTLPAGKQCPKPEKGGGKDNGGYVPVGCFDADPNMKDDPVTFHDKTCMTWTSDKPCMSGLPFYALAGKNMNADACYKFCVSKGMDIFGLQNGAVCRCGASKLNKEVWHEEAPRSNLVFDASALTAAQEGPAGCPLKVFRYKGHFADDGVPLELQDIKEDDLEYGDSVLKGKEVGEGTEEDGTPETLEFGDDKPQEDLLEAESSPGFARPCWPGNCGPGRGPWRDRSVGAPSGLDPLLDSWQEYVLIKYAFESNVNPERKTAFREAVKEWRTKTCVNLLEQAQMPSSGPHIKVGIYSTGSCYLSGMGYGTSKINLGWCNSMRSLGSMIHEIGHAIGMNHEQKRPDAQVTYHGQGPYVVVHWENIAPSWMSHYLPDSQSYTGSGDDGEGDPYIGYADYDFESIMQYGAGGGTIDTIPPASKTLIGQRYHLSSGDVTQAWDTYQCRRGAAPAQGSPAIMKTLQVTGTCPESPSIDGEYTEVGTDANGAPYYKEASGNMWIYWDPSCNGATSYARWAVDNTEPNPSVTADLDGDSGCTYFSRFYSDNTSYPPMGPNTWRVWCDAWTDVTLTITDITPTTTTTTLTSSTETSTTQTTSTTTINTTVTAGAIANPTASPALTATPTTTADPTAATPTASATTTQLHHDQPSGSSDDGSKHGLSRAASVGIIAGGVAASLCICWSYPFGGLLGRDNNGGA